jgi:Bacterial pre-peptidase C-terminal domain
MPANSASLNAPSRDLGNLTGDITYSQRGTVGSGTDQLFKFKLSRSSSISLALGELSGNANLRLLNESGGEIKRSNQSNRRSESIKSRLGQGNYYVQVSGVGGANYKLEIDGSGRSLDPGDATQNALDTGLLNGANRSYKGRVSGRDKDFYRFDLSETGNINLSLSNLRKDVELSLLDSSGHEVSRSMNDNSSQEVLTQSLNAGTYFVQVSRFGSSRARYKLEMSADGSGGSTGGSAGGSTGGSKPGTTGGSLASAESMSSATFSRNEQVGGSDREDTYRFSLNQSGIFSADVTGLAGNSTVKLVRDANNNGAIDSGEVLSSNKTIRRFLNSGTYFLQVSSDNSQSLSYNVGTDVMAVASNSSAIRVTKTNRTTSDGLTELQVSLVKDGKLIDSIAGVSGQPSKQSFRTADISKAGSAEPLPEGYWTLGNVEWASGIKGDESKSWADPPYDGVGPAWVNMQPTYATERGSIGFHLDNNSYIYPGTVGCVGIMNKSDLRKFVSWFDSYDAPKVAIVDWGLGTVEV